MNTPDDQVTPINAQREAIRINVLLGNIGCSPRQVTEWWFESAYSELDGATPLAAWNRGEFSRVKVLVEAIISRQFADQLSENPLVLKRLADLR
jgi:hypothetical protein